MELAHGLAPLTHISFPGPLGLTRVWSWQSILAWELTVKLVCCSHFAALDDQFPLGELKGCDVGSATHSIDPMDPIDLIDPIDLVAIASRREIIGAPGHFGRAIGLEVEIIEGRWPWGPCMGPGHQLVAADLLWI